MAFDEGRCGGGQSRLVGHGEVGRVPARARTYAVGTLEREQELMSQERISISPQGVPLPWVELVNAVMNARSVQSRGQECFSISRASR